jgi:integrase/recombinase XerD
MATIDYQICNCLSYAFSRLFGQHAVKTRPLWAPLPITEEVQKLIDSIDLSHIVGLRDQAILGVLAYTFARIGAVVSFQVKDYFQNGKRSVLRFSEKGGKEKEIPVHHKLESTLTAT